IASWVITNDRQNSRRSFRQLPQGIRRQRQRPRPLSSLRAGLVRIPGPRGGHLFDLPAHHRQALLRPRHLHHHLIETAEVIRVAGSGGSTSAKTATCSTLAVLNICSSIAPLTTNDAAMSQ